MVWRYLAQELPSGRFLDTDLPMTGVSITDTLSGPGALTGTVPVELARLKSADGRPVLREWGAAIWAEVDGEIRGGGIVDIAPTANNAWSLECTGFSGVLQGQPYTGNGEVWSKVDPLDVVRTIWTHWQSQPGGNLGVVVDPTTSQIRIGEEQYIPLDVGIDEADTTFDEGPIRLNWWDTHDLGGVIDSYVQQGFFDYHEQTRWNTTGTALIHRLRLYHPRRGTRRTDLRLALGENILEVPELRGIEEGYATQVMFLGAGEGRNKLRAMSQPALDRIRHLAVITDDTIKRQTDAQTHANTEHSRRAAGTLEMTTLRVMDHPNAPVGSWAVGDEIRVTGAAGWVDLDMWVRIISSTVSPEEGAVAQLEVEAST